MSAGLNLRSESDATVQQYINLLLVDSLACDFANHLANDKQGLTPSDLAPASSIPGASSVPTHSEGESNEFQSDIKKTNAVRPRVLDTDASSLAFLQHLELAQRGVLRRHSKTLKPDGLRPQPTNPLPDWAISPIACLTMKVANLALAIPSQFVAGMKPLGAQTAMPQRDDDGEGDATRREWLLGYSASLELADNDIQNSGRIAIVDTAKMIMPERYDSNMIDGYRYVILLRDVDWCLAVDSVGGEIEIDERSVRWRGLHTRRPWLAGTLVADMCAIVDIDGFNRLLLADDVLDHDNSGDQ